MRSFIALELFGGVKEELARLEGELAGCGADVKWVKPENIHLTVKFLGEVEEGAVGKIKKVLEEVASRNSAFVLGLFKLGAFPDLNRPRVIWVGIDAGCSEVEAIQSSLESGLEKIGFARESRPFSAHLTLGRVKSGKNKSELKEKILTLETHEISCAIDHITLFESQLTPHGPIYTERGRFTLL